MGREVEAEGGSEEGWEGPTVSYRKSRFQRGSALCMLGFGFLFFFFFNIFAYICHFIVCTYRRPYRKLIFVIVGLLILFT